MENNGSPKPVFETDQQSTYFLATLPAHPASVSAAVNNLVVREDNGQYFNSLAALIGFTNQATNQAREILEKYVHARVGEMLNNLEHYMSRADLFRQMELSNQKYNTKKYLDPLIESGWVQMEYPDKKTNPNQRYKITLSGRRYFS